MWDLQEARLRAEVVYRQECCRLAVGNARRAQQVVRRPMPLYGTPGLPSWRRWLALARLALVSFGPMSARTRPARVPRA